MSKTLKIRFCAQEWATPRSEIRWCRVPNKSNQNTHCHDSHWSTAWSTTCRHSQHWSTPNMHLHHSDTLQCRDRNYGAGLQILIVFVSKWSLLERFRCATTVGQKYKKTSINQTCDGECVDYIFKWVHPFEPSNPYRDLIQWHHEICKQN